MMLDCCNSKKSLPVLIALLVVAQIDLASAFGWPLSLLTLLHLTPAPDDLCRGLCSGIGTALDFAVVYLLLRRWARRALKTSGASQFD
jgi:hypothetical protein